MTAAQISAEAFRDRIRHTFEYRLQGRASLADLYCALDWEDAPDELYEEAAQEVWRRSSEGSARFVRSFGLFPREFPDDGETAELAALLWLGRKLTRIAFWVVSDQKEDVVRSAFVKERGREPVGAAEWNEAAESIGVKLGATLNEIVVQDPRLARDLIFAPWLLGFEICRAALAEARPRPGVGVEDLNDDGFLIWKAPEHWTLEDAWAAVRRDTEELAHSIAEQKAIRRDMMRRFGDEVGQAQRDREMGARISEMEAELAEHRATLARWEAEDHEDGLGQ